MARGEGKVEGQGQVLRVPSGRQDTRSAGKGQGRGHFSAVVRSVAAEWRRQRLRGNHGARGALWPSRRGAWLGRQSCGGGGDTEAWGYVLDDWQDLLLEQMRV